MSASSSSLQEQGMSENVASDYVLSEEAEEQLNTHVIQAGKAILELAYTNEELLQELDVSLMFLSQQSSRIFLFGLHKDFVSLNFIFYEYTMKCLILLIDDFLLIILIIKLFMECC